MNKQDKDVGTNDIFEFGLGILYIIVVRALSYIGIAFLLMHWLFVNVSFFEIATPIVAGIALCIVVGDFIRNLFYLIPAKEGGYILLEIWMLFSYGWMPALTLLLYFII